MWVPGSPKRAEAFAARRPRAGRKSFPAPVIVRISASRKNLWPLRGEFAESGRAQKDTNCNRRFDPTKHKVTWYNDKYAVKLDNHAFFGTENTLPKHSITSVVAIIGGDTVIVPQAAFVDLYEPHLYYTDAKGKTKTYCNVYMSADRRKYYIYMLNGNGTGRYEVTWVIQDKHYLRRIVDWGF